MDQIVVRGARTHNLKNINITIKGQASGNYRALWLG